MRMVFRRSEHIFQISFDEGVDNEFKNKINEIVKGNLPSEKKDLLLRTMINYYNQNELRHNPNLHPAHLIQYASV